MAAVIAASLKVTICIHSIPTRLAPTASAIKIPSPVELLGLVVGTSGPAFAQNLLYFSRISGLAAKPPVARTTPFSPRSSKGVPSAVVPFTPTTFPSSTTSSSALCSNKILPPFSSMNFFWGKTKDEPLEPQSSVGVWLLVHVAPTAEVISSFQLTPSSDNHCRLSRALSPYTSISLGFPT